MRLVLCSLVLLSLVAGPLAWADEPPPCPETCPSEPQGLLPVPEYRGRLLCRPKLTGDWCCKRTRLARKGIFLDARWLQVAQGVVDGGRRERWAHTTNLDFYAKFDLMRMRIVPGALVSMRAQSRFGSTANTESGLLLPVNTAGSYPLTTVPDEEVPIALTELNWTQMVSEKLGFFLGKITTMNVANEFAGGEGYSQFMNFQFIFPAAFAQFVPYSTLAAGVVWMPSARVTVSSMLMNTADSSTTTGFDDFDQGQTWWTSATLTHRIACKPGGVTLGAGYAFNGDFARIAGLHLTPSATATVRTKGDTWGLFASGWQYLFTRETPRDIDPTDGQQELRGIGVFAILGLGDEKANPVHWSVAAGLGGRGLIGGRCNDTFGVGYFYNQLGDPLAGGTIGRFLEHDAQGVESWYRFALAESIGLTLDAQWTDAGFPRVDNAILLAARLSIDL